MSALLLIVMLLELIIAQCWLIAEHWLPGIGMVCCACAHYYLATMSLDRIKTVDAAVEKIKELKKQLWDLADKYEKAEIKCCLRQCSFLIAEEKRVKELEAIIGRIQSNRGDETEVDALCDEALGKGGE